MKTPIAVSVLVIALALPRMALGADAFRAVLLAPDEAPGSKAPDERPSAVVVLDGTYLTLFLPLNPIGFSREVHLRKGSAAAGEVIISLKAGISARSMTTSYGLAADIVAHPETYFVDVHNPGHINYPATEYRGQLTRAPELPLASWFFAPDGAQPPAPGGGRPMQRAVGGAGPDFQRPTREPSLSPGDQLEQTIQFRQPAVRYYRDGDFDLAAWASSRLEVAFTATGDCSVSGSRVHLISAGKCFVTAHQPGNWKFAAAPEVDQTISISKARQWIGLSQLKPRAFLDPDFPLEASASSGLPVVFRVSGDCSVSGAIVHLKAAGSCSVTAHQPGDSNFLAAEIIEQQFAIAKGDQTIDFKPLPPPDWWGAAFPLEAVASSGLPVRFNVHGSCIASGSGEILQYIGYGTCTVIAEQPGDENVNPAPSVKQTFTVSKGN